MTMTAMRAEILAALKDSLSLEVKKESVYTGGMDDGPSYRDFTTLRLMLDNECISEVLL